MHSTDESFIDDLPLWQSYLGCLPTLIPSLSLAVTPPRLSVNKHKNATKKTVNKTPKKAAKYGGKKKKAAKKASYKTREMTPEDAQETEQ